MLSFGFITPDDGSADVFIHRSCNGADRDVYLEQGQKVTYEVEWDENKGKWKCWSCDGFKSSVLAPVNFRHKNYRNDGSGKTRTRKKQVLDDAHPLIIKRKQDTMQRNMARRC